MVTDSESALLDRINETLIDEKDKTTPTNPLVAEKIEDSRADRSLKKSYAKYFIFILIGQLLIMNAIFYCAGLGYLEFEEWSLNLYMAGTLAEVFGVILVITKNLFPVK